MAKFLGALFLLALIIRFWVWIVAGVVLWLGWRAACWWLEQREACRVERVRVADGLRERADVQHLQVMAGDERGIYGAFPPAFVS